MPAPAPASYHFLIVEDDPVLQTGLRDYLELEGFAVTTARDGVEALGYLRQRRDYDLVLLDNMLPRMSGFELLRATQQLPARPPVLMMTACGMQHEIVGGFELGVDDYIVKPFSVELLMARIRAVLRRRKPPSERPMDVHRFGDFEVNFTAHQAFRGGAEVRMTTLEFELLRYLIRHENRVVSRDDLLRQVWNVPSDLETRTVDRHIASLRRKIEGAAHSPVFIHTIYGVGYRFCRAH